MRKLEDTITNESSVSMGINNSDKKDDKRTDEKHDDTKTNVDAYLKSNNSFACYKANKLLVIRITSIDNPTKTTLMINHQNNTLTSTTTYECEKVILANNFDETYTGERYKKVSVYDNDRRIKYFKSIAVAHYSRNVPPLYTGHWEHWYITGKLCGIEKYVAGKLSGSYKGGAMTGN
jgi:antitoxin component YwqK of YwqJK toxin-antitoxin module